MEQYRSFKEGPLFTISMVLSCMMWFALIVGTLGIGLIYVLFGFVFYLITHAVFLARIKGNGVRITQEQFPDLHARIVEASKKLGLTEVPEAYLLNDRGGFNAFATRYLGRNFIVLYVDLLECCDENDGSIDFIIAHEIGHLALGHLKWNAVLLPSKMFPLLGPAYSRACEYSCDKAGAAVAGDTKAAVAGLAVLAAGHRYSKRLSIEEYLRQGQETGAFWMGVLELGMSHPYLPKRVGAILNQPAVEGNPMAYVMAPFFGFAGAGGAAASMVMAVAIIGMMAAIAVPNFMKFQQRAAEEAAENSLQQQLMMQQLEGMEGAEAEEEGEEGAVELSPEDWAEIQRAMQEAQQAEDALEAAGMQEEEAAPVEEVQEEQPKKRKNKRNR